MTGNPTTERSDCSGRGNAPRDPLCFKRAKPVSDSPAPLVGVPCDRKQIGDLTFQAVGDKYLRALTDIAQVQPVLLPQHGHEPISDLVRRLDGVLLPGSPSNVHPGLYGGRPPGRGMQLDQGRDALTLPLIRASLSRGIPVFAICRGLQELNVALGGSLHQDIEAVPTDDEAGPRLPHAEILDLPAAERYAARHRVRIASGGLLHRLLESDEISVNSVHSQAIDRLALGLAVEAQAEDGLVEAVRVENASAFALGVQWHPDWRTADTDHYAALFRAFGEASRHCRHLRTQRRRGVGADNGAAAFAGDLQ